MALERDGAVLKQFRTLFHVGMAGGLTDGQLLEQFAARDGEVAELAFAALVERHGPMILRACRVIVRDEHDAEDAFQATFLILARRGGSLWVRDSLGPWLHRVACRVATRSMCAADRRRLAERAATEAARGRIESPASGDRGRAIHQEIDRLPDRYRIPIVLCDVEGLTYESAARHLGCPIGTVKSRLARGRHRLREQLARRGIHSALGLVAAGPIEGLARAAVPVALAETTSRAAVLFATAEGAGIPISASIATLVRGALRSMAMIKFCKVASAGLFLGLSVIGTGRLLLAESPPQAIVGLATARPRADQPMEDLDKIQGEWSRISTDGVKAAGSVNMVVRKATDRPEDDIPGGAAIFVVEWKTNGAGSGSREIMLLAPTERPRALNFFPQGEGSPRVCPGIYQLEGDTLTICFRAIAGKRPVEFAAGRNGQTLDVYRRAKP